MSVSELEARVRMHESTAATMEQHYEPKCAEEFRALARFYGAELDRRRAAENAQTEPGSVADRV
jgi:hypothetical protein